MAPTQAAETLQTKDPAELIEPATSLPSISLLDTIRKIYNFYLPALNYFLTQYGYIRLPKGLPPSETFASMAGHVRGMSALQNVLDKEERDLGHALRGLYISQGIPPERVAPGTDAGAQIDQIARTITSWYPLLYLFYPQVISRLNPRSAYPLAYELSRVFARNTTLASPEQIADWAENVADQILADPRSHQGFTSQELAELVNAAAKRGLISFRDVPSVVNSVRDVVAVAAPLREQVALEGGTFDANAVAELTSALMQKHPAMTAEEIGLEIRRKLALQRRGGEYQMLGLSPETQEYIRRSGVPMEELAKQHEQLKQQAVDSIFGAGLGAIAKAVRTGMVPPNSPAAKLYERASKGLPLGIQHPRQFISILAESGVQPETAMTMVLYPEESKYWLTPALINSLRISQFEADWGRRFAAIYKAFPGNDPESRAKREAMLSRLVTAGGYNNLHHFLALHGPVLEKLPEFRDLALREATLSREFAGYEDVPWGGWARMVARMQDVGKGKRQGTLTIGDLLGPLAQLYKVPDEELRYSGLNPPEDSRSRLTYYSRTAKGPELIESGMPVHVPGVESKWFDPSKYVPASFSQ